MNFRQYLILFFFFLPLKQLMKIWIFKWYTLCKIKMGMSADKIKFDVTKRHFVFKQIVFKRDQRGLLLAKLVLFFCHEYNLQFIIYNLQRITLKFLLMLLYLHNTMKNMLYILNFSFSWILCLQLKRCI